MSNGDYPLGAKDDSSAPYNMHEYTRHVVITIESDVTIESSVSLNDSDVYDKVLEIVAEEMSSNVLDYVVNEVSIINNF